MTTKTFDSTVSEILQDDSSVEYVESQENPLTTIQTEPKNLASANQLFDFHAVHNGEACIESLDPKDRGTERQFWFTVVLLCRAYECSADTIRRRVETLAKTGDINETQNCVSLNVPNQTGNILEDWELPADSTIKESFIVQLVGNSDKFNSLSRHRRDDRGGFFVC